MSASTFVNKFYLFSLALNLLSALGLSLPQSVQAASLTLSQPQLLNPQELFPIPEEVIRPNDNNGIYLDRTIPISELPGTVASTVLENASKALGLPVSDLQITSVRQVTWRNGCMGRRVKNEICTMALVDGWIVTLENSEQKWVYHTNGSTVFLANDDNTSPVLNPPSVSEPLRPDQPGSSQQNPIMPTRTEPGFWSFIDLSSGVWSDPPTAYGFRYEMTSSSLFTKILDFPTGFAKPFSVLVKDVVLGQFTAGNSVNFSNYSRLLGNLLVGGSGVKEFSITGLNVDPTNPAAFPIKLEFNTEKANLNMHAMLNEEVEAVPEPSMMLGLFASASFLVGAVRKRK